MAESDRKRPIVTLHPKAVSEMYVGSRLTMKMETREIVEVEEAWTSHNQNIGTSRSFPFP